MFYEVSPRCAGDVAESIRPILLIRTVSAHPESRGAYDRKESTRIRVYGSRASARDRQSGGACSP